MAEEVKQRGANVGRAVQGTHHQANCTKESNNIRKFTTLKSLDQQQKYGKHKKSELQAVVSYCSSWISFTTEDEGVRSSSLVESQKNLHAAALRTAANPHRTTSRCQEKCVVLSKGEAKLVQVEMPR
mgnify:CR=1 FL=1